MPVNPFTATEVESIREIVGLGTSTAEQTDLNERVTPLNAAQVVRTQTDIARWNSIAYGTTKSRKGQKGTDFDIERDRLLITNRVRMRLNYPQVGGMEDPNQIGLVRIGGPGWAGGVRGDENSTL